MTMVRARRPSTTSALRSTHHREYDSFTVPSPRVAVRASLLRRRAAPAVCGPAAGGMHATPEGATDVGIGTSIVLIAVGAILRFALTLDSTIGSTTVNWPIIGDILMVRGGVGLVISLVLRTRPSNRARPGGPDERVVERDRYYTGP